MRKYDWIPLTLCMLIWNSSALSQGTVQRDPQALAILAQTIAAAGGANLLTSIQDITETGTVTYYTDDPITGNVTVKSRGLRQFRIDADLSEGRRTTVVNEAGGFLIQANGESRPIYRQSCADLGSVTLPYLQLTAAIEDSSTKIIYVGLVIHSGASAHEIRIEKVYTSQQDPTETRGTREAREIYIDPNTLLITAIFDQIHFSRAGHDSVPHEILYSNYQPENGVAIPLTISEAVHGVTEVAIQLSQVTFNSGLSDSEFDW